MADLHAFSVSTGVSVKELREISESQVLNRESQLYLKVVNLVGQKWADWQKVNTAAKVKRTVRVYVPFSQSSTDKYRLASVFPQFELNYATAKRASAPFAQAASLCVSEYMLTLTPKQSRIVLLVGYRVIPALLRNREWVVAYLPGADPFFQSTQKSEDRAVGSIYASMVHKGKCVPNALASYMTGATRVVNTEVMTDRTPANVSCFVLDKLDTNFRQLASWMHRHENKVLFFSIPFNKCMEHAAEGYLSDLDGYVVPRGEKITLMFKDDLNFQRDYTHANYLELIARTRISMHGKTFVKEFVTHMLGYSVYKITSFPGEYSGPTPVYRSWNEPGYTDKTLMITPMLKPGGSVDRPGDWRKVFNVIDDRVLNDVLAMALLNTDAKMDDVIARRINSKAHNYISSNQLTRKDVSMTTECLEAALLTVYSTAFMKKFTSTMAVSTFAPRVREAARLSRGGLITAVSAAVGVFGDHVHRVVTRPVVSMLRTYVGRSEDMSKTMVPRFIRCKGYTSYGDVEEELVGDISWVKDDPFVGFSFALPGDEMKANMPKRGTVGQLRAPPVPVKRGWNLPWGSGEAPGKDVDGSRRSAGIRVDGVVKRPVAGLQRVLSGLIEDMADAEYDPEVFGITDADLEEYRSEGLVRVVRDPEVVRDRLVEVPPTRFLPVEILYDKIAADEISNAVVSKVFGDHHQVKLPQTPYVYNAFLAPVPEIEYIAGVRSDDPVADLMTAISHLYPNSQLMDVSFVEAERVYNDLSIVMRTIRAKIDLSKLSALKPESFYLPAVRTHVVPKIKENTWTVLSTLAKRNADTPYVIDPVSAVELWEKTWAAMLEVYYIPGTAEYLAQADGIVLDEASLREWLEKQSPAKRAKLMAAESFSFDDMAGGVQKMNLMLKTKIKAEMDNSYETSVKLPQSIQYDNTGRSVAVLSPVIRQKVKREQLLLRPDVLVMQRKSVDNVVAFLNQFDHRPNKFGQRYYIEIDQTMFDKTQLTEQHNDYLRVLRAFKVDESYVQFIDQHMNTRSVSSVKAGVTTDLEGQNASGAPYTLDRNNEISKIALALLIKMLNVKVEFVMVMGDDVTIAVRGYPDISDWETEMSRKRNLVSKVMIREHGYFCSMDIVHLPGGGTTVARDVVKAALGFADMSLGKIDDLKEKWISFVDSMRDIDNAYVQEYLRDVLYERWRITHPTVSKHTFELLFRVHSRIKNDYDAMLSFYSKVATTRFY